MDNQSENLLMSLRCLVAIALVTGFSSTSVATTYYVDRVVGPGTISGTIETNGATGVLTSADVIDWNLIVDADGIQATFGLLLGPISGNNSSITLFGGSALTATPTALFFDFSLPDYAVLQIATPGSDVSWQLQAMAPVFSDELIREPPYSANNQSYVAHPPSNQQLATAVVINVVEIDIKPGKTPNSINPTSAQKISVAILTTDAFDAAQVKWDTALFGPGEATEAHARAHVKDVDDDGDMDLLLHFNTEDTGIACGDIEATLIGETFSGGAIEGTDAILTVPCLAVPCPCWEEEELESVTADNNFDGLSCGSRGDYPSVILIQNTIGSTPGVEGGFAVIPAGRSCFTRDPPPSSVSNLTEDEVESCAQQIVNRCALIGDPYP